MATVSHHIEYVVAASLARLVQAMPSRMADSCGASLGRMAHAVLTSRRRIAHDNLKKAFGDGLPDDEISAITRRVFENTGRTLVEFARFGRMKSSDIGETVKDAGVEILRKVHDEGKGGVILSAHFGSWELLGGWVASKGYPIDLLVGRQHNEKVNELLISFRREMDVGIIRIPDSIRQVFKALKANHFVALVSDQHATSGAVVVDFFGRRAATPQGPALFAVRSGCPILPFLLRREKYDRHVVMSGEPIYPPHSGNKEEDIQQMTQAYTGFFEDGIRRYPDQWLWTHRRWKL